MSDRKDARFWNWIAARYARMPIPNEEAYQRKLEITRSYLTPETTLFEFGCGTGSTALRHAPHVARVVATDISDAMIAIARDKAAADGVGNVDFQIASFDTVGLAPESVDVALGLNILHLLRDRPAAIARVFALLRPGGVFISSTFCLGDRMGWTRFIAAPIRALGFLPLFHVLRSETLIAELQSARFAIVEDWRPEDGRTVFLVARKPDLSSGSPDWDVEDRTGINPNQT